MIPRPDISTADIPIEQVIPYARNARTHSEAQIAQIAGSIAEFGFVNPILIGPDGVLVAGHGRVLAALKLGLESIPAIRLGHLSKTQARALALADNRIALSSGWDEAMLAAELAALREEDFDLALLGFGSDELDTLLADEGRAGAAGGGRAGSLAESFGVPPFSLLNAREGWWQDRKRAWIALGIRSELGRGEAGGGDAGRKASPGGNMMPAADYSRSGAKGDGAGRAMAKSRKPNAVPGGSPMPLDRAKGARR